jgi:hypothetical protein
VRVVVDVNIRIVYKMESQVLDFIELYNIQIQQGLMMKMLMIKVEVGTYNIISILYII